MIGGPAAYGRVDAQLDAALLCELERVRQQVLEHLLQAFRVGDHATIELRIDLYVEGQTPVLGFMPERPGDHVLQGDEEHLLGIDRNGA